MNIKALYNETAPLTSRGAEIFVVCILLIKWAVCLTCRVIRSLNIICAECRPAMRTEHSVAFNIVHIYRNTKH